MPLVKIKRSKENRLVHVKLNLPEKRNVLSLKMIAELTEAFEQLATDSEAQVLVLSGEGVHFCAGGDLNWMLFKPESSDTENINQIKPLSRLFHFLNAFPLPVIGDVRGSAFGGALGLIALCDIVLADKKSQFCFSEVKLALAPALIAPFVLKKIAFSKAGELMLSGRVFDSEEALKMNLIHFVGDSKEKQNYLEKLVSQLLSYDRKALKHIKHFLKKLSALKEEEVDDYCLQTLAHRRKSPEAVRRIQSFLNRKKQAR